MWCKFGHVTPRNPAPGGASSAAGDENQDEMIRESGRDKMPDAPRDETPLATFQQAEGEVRARPLLFGTPNCRKLRNFYVLVVNSVHLKEFLVQIYRVD